MTPRKYAEIAAASLAKMLKPGTDSGHVADIVETVLADATREQQEGERLHLAETEAAADARLKRLLDASPAVIYSFKATGRFRADLRQRNIESLFGYAPREYLGNPNFWRERVHPEDCRGRGGDRAGFSKTASRRSNTASAARTAPIAG